MPFVTDPVISTDGTLLVGILDKALTVWSLEGLRTPAELLCTAPNKP